ncbi:MAG: tetratricopeptide repeat protein [Ignavibacteriaceae bacterium]|nr:tetratricopeptide repeat protein [Ignavibacteriaceae bacterium]
MKEIRMLAAIMFTDMVGYTAMMQEDEKRAKLLRDKHRKVLDELVAEHHGRILQYYGDGTLAVFGSAIEASICGMKIQQELHKDPIVPLRIGIHAGDVVYDDEGVYGDGVNVASRIENLALPGSVLISDKVNDELRNHKELNTISLGSFELKNVKHPLILFAINSDSITIPSRNQLAGKVALKDNSIAVLPFVNMSADKENDYFSDGITEEILNNLAKLEGLMVTSRTSSFAFKGRNADIREIGKQLGVKNILEGSVRKAGNKVRITAQLIDIENGYHKWSDTYDRSLEDIFEVQDEIATSISDKMKKSLEISKPKLQVTKIPTDNIEVYNLYLKGMFYWNKWSPEHVQKAMKIYEQAIELEPDFALAYTGLSACNVYLGAVGVLPPRVAYPKGKQFAMRALELDDSIPEAYVSLAMVYYFGDWDWDRSEKCFMRALEINPNYADAHQYYSMLLETLGHNKKALKEAELAFQLDPLNAPISSMLAFTYYNLNMLEESMEQYDKTYEIDPDFGDTWSGKGWLYYKMGEIDKAIETYEKVFKIPGFRHKSLAGIGYLYAKNSEIEKAKKFLRELEEMETPELPLDVEKAIIYAGLQNFDKVFEFLNTAVDNKLGGMNFIKTRYWKDIHQDPRYIEILKRMKLPFE